MSTMSVMSKITVQNGCVSRVSRVVTDHVLQLYIRVAFRLCPFLPNLCRRLDWHVIQRSQKQELLGTYAFSISTIAVSQFSGGIN